jgi:hypothetical protein
MPKAATSKSAVFEPPGLAPPVRHHPLRAAVHDQRAAAVATEDVQPPARLATVTTGTYTGKQGVPVDQFAPTVAQKRTTRYPALTPIDTQTDRRWVFPSDYDWNDLIDGSTSCAC